MKKNYSLAKKQKDAQRVDVSRNIPYSTGYKAILSQRSRKYTEPLEENRGYKGKRIGGFLDSLM